MKNYFNKTSRFCKLLLLFFFVISVCIAFFAPQASLNSNVFAQTNIKNANNNDIFTYSSSELYSPLSFKLQNGIKANSKVFYKTENSGYSELPIHNYTIEIDSGGFITLHSHFLLSLEENITTTIKVESNSLSTEFSLLRKDGADLFDNRASTTKLTGWDFYGGDYQNFQDNAEYIKGFLKLKQSGDVFLKNTGSSTSNDISFHLWVDAKPCVSIGGEGGYFAISHTIANTGNYNIDLSIDRINPSKSDTLYIVAVDKDYKVLRLLPYNNTSKSFNFPQLNIDLNLGDKVYFITSTDSDSIDINNFTIKPNIHKVSFYEDDTLIATQNILSGQKSILSEELLKQNNYSAFRQENFEINFDFETNIISDTKLYAVINEPIFSPKLSASFSSGNLQLSATHCSTWQYQYWIKTRIGETNRESIWKIIQTYTTGLNKLDYAVSDSLHLIDNVYSVILRVKDESGNIYEIAKNFSRQDLNQTYIESIFLNEQDALYNTNIINGNTLNLSITANNATNYLVCFNDKEYSSDKGSFTISLNNIKAGFYKLSVLVSGTSDVTKSINVFIAESFLASSTPVIIDYSGKQIENDITLFNIKLKNADGSKISDINSVFCKLYTSGKILKTTNIEIDNVLNINFEVSYSGLYGIYFTEFKVKNVNSGTWQDTSNMYYSGFARKSELRLDKTSTNININESIELKAFGSIENVKTEDLLYAFYKEDSAGWTLIKNYSTDNTYTFSTSFSGNYNLQVRVKDKNAGSWESSSSTNITVGQPSLDPQLLTLKILDDERQEVSELEAGKAYILKAEYLENKENILYRFLLSTDFLGAFYISDFNISGETVFYANKDTTFNFTVRVIDCNNFGYMDINKKLTCN